MDFFQFVDVHPVFTFLFVAMVLGFIVEGIRAYRDKE